MKTGGLGSWRGIGGKSPNPKCSGKYKMQRVKDLVIKITALAVDVKVSHCSNIIILL